MEICINKWIAYAFIPGGKICFDTFIAVSCWFLVDQDFKSYRFIKMWFEVLFYSIVTTVLAIAFGTVLTGGEVFSAFLPITGGMQGYAQTYLAFYLLMPFLSKISRDMGSGQNLFIIAVLTLFVIVSRIMPMIAWSEQSVYCRVILFVYVYFIMRYIKRNPIKCLENSKLMFAVFAIGWVLTFGFYVGSAIYPEMTIWEKLSILFVDEGGMVYFVSGLAFFFFFKSIKIKRNRIINHLGQSTLAVLLIHDGHFFRACTWGLLYTTEWFYSKIYGIRIILSCIFIYGVCTMIDDVRKRLIEEPFFRIKAIQGLCLKMDDLLKN